MYMSVDNYLIPKIFAHGERIAIIEKHFLDTFRGFKYHGRVFILYVRFISTALQGKVSREKGGVCRTSSC